ncbi:hypothetical protein [Geodermatophilus pulveris]|nr:hypothetical protein [Geodermatophilus pulveris]
MELTIDCPERPGSPCSVVARRGYDRAPLSPADPLGRHTAKGIVPAGRAAVCEGAGPASTGWLLRFSGEDGSLTGDYAEHSSGATCPGAEARWRFVLTRD